MFRGDVVVAGTLKEEGLNRIVSEWDNYGVLRLKGSGLKMNDNWEGRACKADKACEVERPNLGQMCPEVHIV